jgi:hypothetical protein
VIGDNYLHARLKRMTVSQQELKQAVNRLLILVSQGVNPPFLVALRRVVRLGRLIEHKERRHWTAPPPKQLVKAQVCCDVIGEMATEFLNFGRPYENEKAPDASGCKPAAWMSADSWQSQVQI